ncbi:PAS domain-containing sensor histidine kinase [Nitrosopumilus maritimus]|uniref:Histidine kinase n=1 Tax=Nitrosopumilus maritimus (strain SCM1) TaxID=436308 RepID=A9A1G4_NITMS|nr:PAS domain-containing sensor histidine kinase [Nitrosopumilus maritimus]ABX13143.1 histidine kinase [Nitrosopumilus maritimus SCM1]
MALGKNKILWGLLGLIIISVIVTGFYINDFTKTNIRESLIEEKTEIQMIMTKSLAASVNSEFQRLLTDMKTISESAQVQESLTSSQTQEYLSNRWNNINSITKISDIFLTDDSLTIVSQVNDEKFRLVGLNLQNIQSSEEFKAKPGYSGEIFSTDGIYRVLVSSPIIDSESGEFKGIVFGIVEPSEIISKYIGIYEIDISSITIFDENQKILFAENTDLLGKEFSSYFAQRYFGENEIQNSHYENIFLGNTDSFVYEAHRFGDVISTGTPVSIEEKNRFFFFVTTPVNQIVEDIEDNLFVEDLKNNLILFIITILFIVIVIKRVRSIENEKLLVIGQLASNIAHDIRNPLGTIRSSVTRIEKQNETINETINQETERIKRSVARMNHQVESVLNYVRTTPLNLSENSLNDLIQSSINSLVIPKNIELNIPKEDIKFECDSDKFKVVFENLLLNAVQSIDSKEGKISINSNQNEKEITISFENSGPNITEENISKIFRPLFTSKLKGTGLGLSSCQNIITQHQGTILVTNNPVTFTIKIPKNLRKEK